MNISEAIQLHYSLNFLAMIDPSTHEDDLKSEVYRWDLYFFDKAHLAYAYHL